MSSPDSDSIPTAQFDSLYALSHVALTETKEHHALLQIFGASVPGCNWAQCGWCPNRMTGVVFLLDCQICRAPRQVCYVCRHLSKIALHNGQAATLCVLASSGCRRCWSI